MIQWVYLAVAIVFEVIGTASMKMSEGFTRLLPSINIFVCYAIAFVFLTLTLKRLDLGLVYALWAGIGTALICVISYFLFGEPMNAIKVVSITLIIVGVIGLKFAVH